jgi:sulfur-oxidizing protein SoxZ
MSDPITLSLSQTSELVEIEVRVAHATEAEGTPNPRTGKTVPGNFLQTIAIQLNERTLLEGQLGPGLAQNPVFKFSFRGVKAGDKFLVSCTDNKARNFAKEIVVPAFKNQ